MPYKQKRVVLSTESSSNVWSFIEDYSEYGSYLDGIDYLLKY